MVKRKIIIFDLDGTLVDVSNKHYKVYVDIVNVLCGKPLGKKEYWNLKRNRASISEILKKSFIEENQALEFKEKFIQRIELSKYLLLDKLFPYTKKILDLLFENYDLYLVSHRSSHVKALREIESFGLTNYFKKIIIKRRDVQSNNTKVSLVKQIASKGEIVVVGDTEEDIQAIINKGISVAVLSGIRNRENLKQFNPNYVIADISVLPRILRSL